MKTILLTPDRFKEQLSYAKRIWNGREGLSHNQNKHLERPIEPDRIYVRNDGWSIATERAHDATCRDLWDDEWEVLYLRNEKRT